jgi:hypothetical protein
MSQAMTNHGIAPQDEKDSQESTGDSDKNAC